MGRNLPNRTLIKKLPGYFRTLARIVERSPECFGVVIPAWDPNKVVQVPIQEIPQQFHQSVLPVRTHVIANLAARSEKELDLGRWELS